MALFSLSRFLCQHDMSSYTKDVNLIQVLFFLLVFMSRVVKLRCKKRFFHFYSTFHTTLVFKKKIKIFSKFANFFLWVCFVLCRGCVLVLSCLRLGCVLVMSWFCRSCVLVVSWLCLGCALVVSWLYLGCVFGVSCLCLDCVLLCLSCVLVLCWLCLGLSWLSGLCFGYVLKCLSSQFW